MTTAHVLAEPQSRVEQDAADRLDEVFPELSRMVHETTGVLLPERKVGLVRSRLRRRLRELGYDDFPSYFEWVTSSDGGEERIRMIDLLTTNKTHFYRESGHFEFLASQLDSAPFDAPEVQIWSAGCSSGEEPYTLSALMRAHGMPGRRFRILATDISTRMVQAARKGEYAPDQARDVPPDLRRTLFEPSGSSGGATLKVRAPVMEPVTVARLNLLDPWPMKRPFQAIFCRNVMIYFDHATRERLVNRFAERLAPDGLLFVGHSESLHGLQHRLRYVRPAVYRR